MSKFSNTAKRYSIRLFSALRQEKGREQIIDVVLLSVTTANALLNFLPNYIGTGLGVLTLSKLLYEYLPNIVTGNHISFVSQHWTRLFERPWLRVTIACFAVPGYLTHLITGLSVLFITMILAFVAGFPFAAWGNKKVRKPLENVIPEIEERSNKCGELMPDSLTERVLLPFEWWLPGVFFSVLCILFCCVFAICSTYSKVFALIFVAWILQNALTRFKKRTSKPDMKKDLMQSVSLIGGGPKGIWVFVFIFAGFLFCGTPPCIVLGASLILWPILLLLFFPSIFQFLFWYAMLKRAPSFIYCWKGGLSKMEGFPLPKGGVYAFIISSVYFCGLFVTAPTFSNQVLEWRWVYQLLVFVFLLTNLVYLCLILLTIQEWRRKKTTENICGDNIRLPLAFSFQLLPFLVGMLVANFDDSRSLLIIGIMLIVVLPLCFFIPDYWNFLARRHGTMWKTNLSYLPILGFLFGADFSIFIFEGGSIAFYFCLILSVALFCFTVLGTVIIYRQKKLSGVPRSSIAKRTDSKQDS